MTAADFDPGWRRCVRGAAAWWLFDGMVLGEPGFSVLWLLGILLFGVPAALIRARYAGVRRRRVAHLGVYALAALLVVATVALHDRLARHRAQTVIEAVQAYRLQHQRWPASLDELVPAHLDAVPRARFTLAFSGFHYLRDRDRERPALLYVAVPPFGRPVFDFASASWGYLD